MNERVSIVIPCYNAQDFVAETIESALGQDYPDVEVVVVDDGSTDGSTRVLESFADRIRWESGPNRGACAARNRGLQLATGNYIQFVDADDVLMSDKLTTQMPFVMQHSDSLVFCAGEFMHGKTHHPHHNRKDDFSDSLIYMLRGGLPTPAPIHRREWIEQCGGWDESLPCAQERDLHLRIAAFGIPFLRIPDVLYRVRPVEDSVSSSMVRVLNQHAGTVEKVLKILQSADRLTAQYRHEIAGLLARDARSYFRLGEEKRGHNYLHLAREIHPSGGTDIAYSPAANTVRGLIGPALTERLVGIKRRK